MLVRTILNTRYNRFCLRMAPTSSKRPSMASGNVSPPPTKRQHLSNSGTVKAEVRFGHQGDRINQAVDPSASAKDSIVSNFFKPVSEKAPSKASWRIVDGTLLACKYDKEDPFKHARPRKVAAFDYDSTLITTQSGKKFGKEASDWKWWHASVEGQLRKLSSDGYLLCIISNQGGLTIDTSTSKTPKADAEKVSKWKQKARAVLETLDLPIVLYAATEKDIYRKPRTGMWRQLLHDQGLAESDVDLEGSQFVGDAGGRIQERADGPKKDFSSSDRDFATNVGIRFLTPEEFFLEEPPRPFKRNFEPSAYLAGLTSVEKAPDSPPFTKRNEKDIVLFVGSPGAGKSTFYWTQLKPLGYARVNQDILRTRDKCLSTASSLLASGESVAVDNTNASVDVRHHWVELAREQGVPIRCVLFTAGARLCEHNDAVRALGGRPGAALNPERRTQLPARAFADFEKRYQVPQEVEGFEDITRVKFKFDGSEEDRKIWGKYWVS